MGFLDRFTGAHESERSHAIRGEDHGVRGLSRETMDAVAAGEVDIADDHPQARILKDMGGRG